MTTVEKLNKALQDMPEPILAELLDFAEFLRGRMAGRQLQTSDEPLAGLKGGLEDSATFAGDPLEIQQRLRDEWH